MLNRCTICFPILLVRVEKFWGRTESGEQETCLETDKYPAPAAIHHDAQRPILLWPELGFIHHVFPCQHLRISLDFPIYINTNTPSPPKSLQYTTLSGFHPASPIYSMGLPSIHTKDDQGEYLEQFGEVDAATLAAEEKALVRKIDLFLLPTIWLMYLVSCPPQPFFDCDC